MVTSRGQVRVEQLAAETGWSRKRLWSRFRSQLGLTPKRAAQLIRFDHAAHRLAAGHSAALVAAESGYADQSHLHRDVVAFAGVTPGAVAVAPWLAADHIAGAPPTPPPPKNQAHPTPAPGPRRAGPDSGTFLQDTRRCARDPGSHAWHGFKTCGAPRCPSSSARP